MGAPACDGIQVVELGDGTVAASIVGMLLADNGARVVKVEPPEGDRLRRSSPPGFLVWNRGKESVVADLDTAEGRASVKALLEAADVVIEAYGAGVAEGWGLGYEDLRSVNPGLVYCSIRGFGSTGAYAHLAADDGVVSTKAGYWTMGAFGFRDGPIFNSGHMASNGAAHQATGGILAALLVRERTGRGQHVEASLARGLGPYDYYGTMTWQHVQRQTGQAAGTSAIAATATGGSRVSFTCPTGDGRWINFTHMLANQARALSRAVGVGDTIDDPRLANQPLFATAEDAAEWEDRVWEALRTKTYAEWEPILLADGDIAFEMARRCEEGLDHAQIRHNGEVVVVDDADHGPIEQVGPIARFSETPARIERSAPRLDEHGAPFTRTKPVASGPSPDHPLAGVTIVELGYFYAMPYGVTMAAALGARVIKLEGELGDPMRTAFGVPEVPAVKLMEGKESISIDLRTPEGQAVARRIVATADVFVDGFRPGVAARLGLGRDTIREVNPSILHVCAAGYGPDGPYASRPIYAGVASSIAGQVYRHAGYWLDPEITSSLSTPEAQVVVLPRLRGPVDGDANAAIGVFTTIMLGLFARARSGAGQNAVTSMIGANAFAYADDFNRYRDKEPLAIPDAENLGLHALYRVYPTAEGWVFLGAADQHEWEALATALLRADLVDDDRFRTAEARAAHDDALAETIGTILATRSAAAWEAELAPKGIACAAAFGATNSEFTNTDPVLRDMGLVTEVDHPTFGRILRHGLPVVLSETPGRVAAGCTIGQHTDAVLAGIGCSPDEIGQLRAAKVVF